MFHLYIKANTFCKGTSLSLSKDPIHLSYVFMYLKEISDNDRISYIITKINLDYKQ